MPSLALLPTIDIWLFCALSVVLGAILQKVSGAGFGMIVAPLMTHVAPDWIPGTVVLLGLAAGFGAIIGSHREIVAKDLPPAVMGRTLGAIVAVWIASVVVASPMLPIVIACIVLLAVALSLVGLSVPINRISLLAAGTLSGIMGTLSGIGAPPVAILYSTVERARATATQNTIYGFGTVTSIIALVAAGLLQVPHIVFAMSLAPLVFIGLLLSRPLVRRFERKAIRPWALSLSAISALSLLVRSL